MSQSAEEATEAIEVSEEAGPNENEESTLGPFTEHVFTDSTHRYLTYSLVNHKKNSHQILFNFLQFSKPILFLQNDGMLFAEYFRK